MPSIHRLIACLVIALLWPCPLVLAQEQDVLLKLAGPLRELAEQPAQTRSLRSPLQSGDSYETEFATRSGSIIVDLTVLQDLPGAVNAVALVPGTQILASYQGPGYAVISAAIDPSRIEQVAAIQQVRGAWPVVAFTNGVTLGQGVAINEAEQVFDLPRMRQFFPEATGQGIRIGVLSDSANLVDGMPGGPIGIAESQATGDLPLGNRVQILMDQPSAAALAPTDEGRAMMELIYDLVPNVDRLVFATAMAGEATFARNIQLLADAGCGIITDDVRAAFEPIYQPGIIADSINHFLEARGGIYTCSAGNYGDNSYEQAFTDTNFDTLHEFTPGQSELKIDIPPGGKISIELQWAEAIGSVNKDYALELIDRNNRLMQSNTYYINNLVLQRPADYLSWTNNGGSTRFLALRVRQVGGSPLGTPLIRITALKGKGEVVYDFPAAQRRGAISPHGSLPLAMAIAAANADSPNSPESFSSHGVARWLFNADGSLISNPSDTPKPDFMSVDGCSNSFFGTPSSSGDPPRFFGTSAAAPNAAALAALITNVASSRIPNPDVNDLRYFFQASASGQGVHDKVRGYGLLNGLAAGFVARGPIPAVSSIYPAPSGAASAEFLLSQDLSISAFRARFGVAGNVRVSVEPVQGVVEPLVCIYDEANGDAVSVSMAKGTTPLNHLATGIADKRLLVNVATINQRTDPARYRITLNGPKLPSTAVALQPNNTATVNSSIGTANPIRTYRFTVPSGPGGRLEAELTPSGFRGRLAIYSDEDTLASSGITNSGIPNLRSWDYGIGGRDLFVQVASDNYDGTGSFVLKFTWYPNPLTGIPNALSSFPSDFEHVVRPNPVTGFDLYAADLQAHSVPRVLWVPSSLNGTCQFTASNAGETLAGGIYAPSGHRLQGAGFLSSFTLGAIGPSLMGVGIMHLVRAAPGTDTGSTGVPATLFWSDPPTSLDFSGGERLEGSLLFKEVTGEIAVWGENDYYKYVVPDSGVGYVTFELLCAPDFNGALDLYDPSGAFVRSANSANVGGVERIERLEANSESVHYLRVRGSKNSGNFTFDWQHGGYTLKATTYSSGTPYQLNIAEDTEVIIARPAPNSGVAYNADLMQELDTRLTVFVPATTSARMEVGLPSEDGEFYSAFYDPTRTLMTGDLIPKSYVLENYTVQPGMQYLHQLVAFKDLYPPEPGFEVENFLRAPQVVHNVTLQLQGDLRVHSGSGVVAKAGSNVYYRFTMPSTGPARISVTVNPTPGFDVGFTLWNNFDSPVYNTPSINANGPGGQEVLVEGDRVVNGQTYVLHIHSGKQVAPLNDASLMGGFSFSIVTSAGSTSPLPLHGHHHWALY